MRKVKIDLKIYNKAVVRKISIFEEVPLEVKEDGTYKETKAKANKFSM